MDETATRDTLFAREIAAERLQEALFAKREQLTIDPNGHSYPLYPEDLQLVGFLSPTEDEEVPIAILEALTAGFLNGAPLPAAAHGVKLRLRGSNALCGYCNDPEHEQLDLAYTVDGYTLTADRPCLLPDGPFQFILWIRSGVLAIGTELRHCFPNSIRRQGTSYLDERRHQAANASLGVLTLGTSEGCKLHRLETGELLIGKGFYDADEVDIQDLPGKPVAEVEAADLHNSHSWSFADGADIPETKLDVARIPTKNGLYVFETTTLSRGFRDAPQQAPTVVIRIRWVANLP